GVSVDLSWMENGAATLWEVEYDTAGFTPGTGNATNTATNPHNLSGLAASTSYDFYVRAICGAADSSVWVGPFNFVTGITCPAPSNLAAAVTTTTADLSWLENGVATLWEVEYDTAGFTPGTGNATNTSTNPHNIVGLTASTNYNFYVRAICGAGDTSLWTGPFNFATTCIPPVISSYPYSENFDAETAPAIPCGWTIANDNADANQWETNTLNPNSGANALYVNYNAGMAANDWIFTPELQLISGTAYDITFAYRARTATYVESLSMAIGMNRDSVSMNTILFDSINFNHIVYDTVTVNYVATSTGAFYVGFFSYSSANQWGIHIDDFSIDVGTITAVSTIENNVALNVYPNPNKGVFTLNVNTTDVKELNIKVINAQGQAVYAKNNFDNINNVNEQIDLSNNAKGIYFINVTTDKGVKTHKVVVQ
ncbi:MAG: T9SS type A sorting domain-containing protein, partial [Vicingaceae bacterium]